MPTFGSSTGGRVKNVMDFGADPTGVADSYPAFAAALAALPKYGGEVVANTGDTPAIYNLSQTLALGDGTASTASTLHGMVIRGEGAVAFPTMAGSASINAAPVTLKYTGAAAGTAVAVRGPLSGWGLRDLCIDANSLAIGLNVSVGQYGWVDGLAVLNGTSGVTLTSTANLSGITCNSMHNTFNRVSVLMPNLDQAIGIRHLGAGGAVTNTCYNQFRHVSIVVTPPDAAKTVFGIQFNSCDTESYENVHMTNFTSGAGTKYNVVFNYGNGQNAGWPYDCVIQNIDFGTGSANAVINSGTPTGSPVNRILGVVGNNGKPANPALASLVWGYSTAT